METAEHLGDLLRLGTVFEADLTNPDGPAVVVETGDLKLGPIPFVTSRAGRVSVWSAPSVGEQILIASPEGDSAQAIALGALWSAQNPAPSTDPDLTLIAFEDGAQISYHQGSHALSVSLPAGGSVTIQADGGLQITGDVSLTGDLAVSGTVTAGTDVVGAGISLKGHKHSGVSAGSALTGNPQ